jgi:hypothetical protein
MYVKGIFVVPFQRFERRKALPASGERNDYGFSATVLGLFWSATMNTTIFVR